MAPFPTVSIIFPNHNGGKQPLECLASIAHLSYPKDNIETIIIDNHSTDQSDGEIKKRFPWVKLIKMQKNVGFAKAINVGIRKSSGEYIFIGNDDIVFDTHSLANLMEYITCHTDVGIVGGKIFSKAAPQKISSCGYMMNTWSGNVYPAPNPNTLKEPDWVAGCACLMPKNVVQTVGLFDEAFTHFFEDQDLCVRIQQHGYKVVYVPSAIFWHGESTTSNKNKTEKYYQWYKNKIRFVLKNLSLVHIITILTFQTVLIAPYRALLFRDGRFVPFLKGAVWNIRNISATIQARKKRI